MIEYPTQTAALLKPYRVNKGTEDNPSWTRARTAARPTGAPKVAEGRRSAPPTRPAGRSTCTRSATARSGRRSTRFEAALAANGRTDNRHTITHLELVDPKDFARFAKLGVLASMQMQWAERDSYTVERLRDYLGTQALAQHLPGRLAAPRRARLLCGGSDWPVDPLLPFRQIEMAVNRTADEVYVGRPEAAVRPRGSEAARVDRDAHPKQRLPAPSGGNERRIVEGLAADLAVLDRDLLRVPLKRVSKPKSS